MTRKQEIKAIIAILSFSFLLMGVVAAASGLSVINAHFHNISQTRVQMIISLPSIVIIIATLAAGKLQEYISKKTVLYIGILLFFVAGVAPAFMKNFTLILVMRGLFGVGLGFMQPMSSSIVSYFFEGEKQKKVMGWQSAAQQVGSSGMSLLGGVLANAGWNYTFFAHGFALIPLILVPFFLPKMKAARKDATERGEKMKITITRGVILWTCAEFFFFLLSQTNAIYNPYLIAERGLGTPADLGISYMFSCITGMTTGLLFSRIHGFFKRYTYCLGLMMLVIGDFFEAIAPNMISFYVAIFIAGISFGITVPVMIVGVSQASDKFSAAMSMAIAMSAKSVAQFICPYVFTALADACVNRFGRYGRNQWVFLICSAILLAAVIVISVAVAIRNRHEKSARLKQ